MKRRYVKGTQPYMEPSKRLYAAVTATTSQTLAKIREMREKAKAEADKLYGPIPKVKRKTRKARRQRLPLKGS